MKWLEQAGASGAAPSRPEEKVRRRKEPGQVLRTVTGPPDSWCLDVGKDDVLA